MINQFDTIANRLPDILNRITSATFANQAFDTEKPLPYHDNRLKLIMPLDRNTDITITLTRTRAGKRINYNPDEILKYYRKASITVGPRNSNRCYHVNLRFWKGEIVPLKSDMNKTRKSMRSIMRFHSSTKHPLTKQLTVHSSHNPSPTLNIQLTSSFRRSTHAKIH